MFENEWFPKANAIGVTWQEFWGMNPRIIKLLIKGFKEKNELELQIENQIAHLQGKYFVDALLTVVGNAIKAKGSKPYEYPKKPYEFSKEEITELTEEEKRRKTEQLFMQLQIMGANFKNNQN